MEVRPLTELMNEWFRAVTGCIRARNGIVDKFLGDCVYARWTASDGAQMQAVLRAVDAACELNRLSDKLNRAHPELPHPLGIGAGVNFGLAAIGTDQGKTALGDTVNLTFRLQEQTRTLGKDLVIADEAYRLLPESVWANQEQRVKVKGKRQPVNIVAFSFEQAETLLRLDADTRQRA
jgi:adenylate cyclase